MFVIWGPEAATGERGADFEIPTQLLAAACFLGRAGHGF
jgi:hypothetical protein